MARVAEETAEQDRQRVAEVLAGLAAGVRQRQAETAALGTGGEVLGPRLLDLRLREQLQEPPCVSPRPLIGPLLVLARKAVFHLFLKWYLRGVLEQQQAFNQASSRLLQDLAAELTESRRELAQLRSRLLQLERGGEPPAAAAAQGSGPPVATAAGGGSGRG